MVIVGRAICTTKVTVGTQSLLQKHILNLHTVGSFGITIKMNRQPEDVVNFAAGPSKLPKEVTTI